MSKARRIIVLAILSLLFTSIATVPNQAFAWSSEFGEQPHNNVVIENEDNVIQAFERSYEACMNYENGSPIIVDMSDLELTKEQAYKAQYLLHSNGELFWINTYNDNNFKQDKFSIPLRFNKDTIDSMRTELEEKVDEVISSIPEEATEEQTVRIVHDYIVKRSSYVGGSNSYSAYGCLVEGGCHCFGYTHAFDMIMHRLGFNTALAYSDYMDHVWNLVEVDGKWLHVDLTWDDTSSSYKYYLLSDDEIEQVNHTCWFTYHECPDSYEIEQYLPGRHDPNYGVYVPPVVDITPPSTDPVVEPEVEEHSDNVDNEDEQTPDEAIDDSDKNQLDEVDGDTEENKSEELNESEDESSNDSDDPTEHEESIDLSNAKVIVKDCKYNGSKQKPEVKVVLNGEKLNSNCYSVTYKNNKNVGNAIVNVTGKNGYNGTVNTAFKILKANQKVSLNSVSISRNDISKGRVKTKLKYTCNSGNKLSFKKVSSNSKVSVSKNGVIALKKGNYKVGKVIKVKVKVTSKSTSNYNKLDTYKTIKIKIVR